MEKKIYVTKSSMPPKEEYYKEIADLWDSHILTNMGVKHEKLKEQLKLYLDTEQIMLFSNGHMALELLIQAMDLKGEIITTPFTFASTTHAIVRNGLTPVFCDINRLDYTLDPTKIENLITEKTSAILPVHVYGKICMVEKIEEIAHKYNLKVIYDAAHAFGEYYKGMSIANYGDASMFSFHATKVFNTIEGGAVCFKNKQLGDILYKLKNFGIQSETIVDSIGTNAKMNEFQAAMGLCNLRHINEEIQLRKAVTERYRDRLFSIPGIHLPPDQKDVISNYAYFPILINLNSGCNRDIMYHNLKKHNIIARKYFYPLTSEFKCYKGKYSKIETPVAKEVSGQVLTLLIYADLPFAVIDSICDIIEKSLKS